MTLQKKDMFDVIVREIRNVRHHMNEVELGRAKAIFKSKMLMQLEARPVMLEDLGRQVLTSGVQKDVNYYMSKIGEGSYFPLPSPNPYTCVQISYTRVFVAWLQTA